MDDRKTNYRLVPRSPQGRRVPATGSRAHVALAHSGHRVYLCGEVSASTYLTRAHQPYRHVPPPSPFNPRSRRQRALLATLVIALMMGTVGAAFFRAQVLDNSRFKLRSDNNRLRIVPIPAPRGAMFDRNGELVAETVPSHALLLEPAPLDSIRDRLERLAPVLDLDSLAVHALLVEFDEHSDEALRVTSSLSFEQLSWVEEHRGEIPGVLLDTQPLRHYPDGAAVAHLVGYVGEISKREMEDSAWQGYTRGQPIGKAGLERQYERVIAGQPGARYMEVDARGRVVARVADRYATPPVRGQDIQLTLDLELQRYAHHVFPKKMRGAIVAMVPSTGEILALYSHPSYDPNHLTGRINPRVWRDLNTDAGRPLLNRATFGIYPPGSTWKLATALIGLDKGSITPDTRFPVSCSGGMSYAGRYARCWKPTGHGSQSLEGAIASSCNVYFYQLGIRLGINQLAREGTRLGFGRRTGVDLPVEKAGTFPEDTGWYRRRFGWTPTPSEVMSLAIGQGPNAQTPLRMAQFFSALAGDGSAPTPHLLRRGENAALVVETDLRVTPQALESVRRGLARVVEPGGTAYMASLKHWKLYGKTGTSQNSEDLKRPHAWFTGFAGAPDGTPEIAVAVVVEFGESGSGAAAPLAAKVADFYLNRKHGRPVAPLQTLSERTTGKVFGTP
jgi:penicillin-binding protein 2